MLVPRHFISDSVGDHVHGPHVSAAATAELGSGWPDKWRFDATLSFFVRGLRPCWFAALWARLFVMKDGHWSLVFRQRPA